MKFPDGGPVAAGHDVRGGSLDGREKPAGQNAFGTPKIGDA